jgi:hypothetical protein
MSRPVKASLRTAGSRLFSAARLALGAALFLPLILFMMWVNYTVDRSGTFQGTQYLREVANMLLSGQDVVGYEQLNERQRDITEILVANMDPAPDTIALGSSRIMQMDTELADGGTFFNFAMTGADYYDIIGTFYLFDRQGTLPKNVIIGVDPWLFDTSADSTDARSNKELYAAFLWYALGMEVDYEEPDATDKWEALYSPSYFQGNISYVFQSKDGVKKPQPVFGDLYAQNTEVKRYDGSLLYALDYRTRSQEDRDGDALYQTVNFFRMEEYTHPDSERLKIFEQFLSYMQGKGINVFLVLTPYHPIAYDNALEKADHYSGFFATEPAIRRIAEQLNIPVYGSYNPHAIIGVTSADFYDGIHCTAECIAKLFPGVEQALINEAEGVDISLNYEITPGEAIQRDLALSAAAQEASAQSAA